MNTLLEVVLAVVSTLVVLALAAQAFQELIKHTFAIKGWTKLTAIKRLVIEAARTARLGAADGEDIVSQVIDRLRRLSQNGVKPKSVRLDALSKEQLMELIRAVDGSRVGALRPLGHEEAKARLADVAAEAARWYELADEPVVDRYRRRMQLTALGAGLAVVLAVNADFVQLVRQARNDPAFRARAIAAAGVSLSADSGLRTLQDSLVRLAADSTTAAQAAALAPLIRSASARRDSTVSAALRSESGLFLGYPNGFRPTWRWGLGIVLSALLVGLGAPFWHDVLETVFGLKTRVRVGAERARQSTPSPSDT